MARKPRTKPAEPVEPVDEPSDPQPTPSHTARPDPESVDDEWR